MGYPTGSNTLYELLEAVPPRPNRLVLFVQSQLHNAYIDPPAARSLPRASVALRRQLPAGSEATEEQAGASTRQVWHRRARARYCFRFWGDTVA